MDPFDSVPPVPSDDDLTSDDNASDEHLSDENPSDERLHEEQPAEKCESDERPSDDCSPDEDSSLAVRFRALGRPLIRHDSPQMADESRAQAVIDLVEDAEVDGKEARTGAQSASIETGTYTGFRDLLFLHDVEPGCGALLVSHSELCSEGITGLNMDKISSRCKGLASRFESITPVPQLNHPDVEQTLCCDMTGEPIDAVIAVLRWIYMDDYGFCEAMIDHQVPLLLHLQILRLAQTFGSYLLEHSVLMHVEAEIALAVETRRPILGLCEAIRYLYTHLREGEGLRSMVSCYITRNLELHLEENEEAFKQTVFQCPLFHRDLTRANYESNFKSPKADTIIRLSTCEHSIHKVAGVVNDFTCEFHIGLGQHARPITAVSVSLPHDNASASTQIYAPPVPVGRSLRRKLSSEDDADDEELPTGDSPTKRLRQTTPPRMRRHSTATELGANLLLSLQHKQHAMEDGSTNTSPSTSIKPLPPFQRAPSIYNPRTTSESSKQGTAMMREMRYNARRSVDGYFAEHPPPNAITEPKSSKQQAAAKSALTTLLKGSGPYSNDREQASSSSLAVEKSQGDEYDVVDLSEEDEWELVKKV